jgi:hypothetical protein
MTENQEKIFQRVWRRYKSIAIEEREARKIFEAGMRAVDPQGVLEPEGLRGCLVLRKVDVDK